MSEVFTAQGRRSQRSRKHRGTRLITVAALLLVAVFLLGCGGSDDETTTDGGSNGTEPGFAPNIVTESEIDAQEQGSPGRALLEWWQAFQFKDVATVESLTSEDTLDEIGAKQLTLIVNARGPSLQGIVVLGVSESGETASVRVALLTFQPEEGKPPPTEPTSSTPTTFTLQKQGNKWLFNDPAYLQPFADALAAAQEQQSDEQDGGK